MVAQLRAEGHEISDEDVARLSPLKHKYLNCLGRYRFTATQPSGGILRPLRDLDAAGLDDDEDGTETARSRRAAVRTGAAPPAGTGGARTRGV